MKKRAMSLLLALVMMLALLPAQTWATDTVDEPGEAEEQTMPAEPQEEALKAEKTAEAPQVQAEAVTSGTCGRADALAANQAGMAEREWHKKGSYIW